MTKRVSLSGVIGLVAVLVLNTGAVSAAQPDGAYGRFQRGIVMVDQSNSLFNAGFVGTQALSDYVASARSIGCNGTPAPANRILQVKAASDANGGLFFSKTVTLNGPVSSIRSFWLALADGSQPAACVVSIKIEHEGVVADADGSLGFLHHANIDRLAAALVEKRPDNRVRLSLALDGLADGHNYRADFVGGACGHARGNSYYVIKLLGGSIATFKSSTKAFYPGELEDMLSVRVIDRTTGTPWGCIPLNINWRRADGG